MKSNFLYKITAASRTPDEGATAPRSPFFLSSTEFVELPEQNSWVRHWLLGPSRNLCTEKSPKENDGTRCCTNTIVPLKMITIVLETCTGCHYTVLYKVPLFLSDFSETGIFLVRFSKNFQISNFVKTRRVGAEIFHADGRTDITS